jgi:glucose/arabinose dehydrogenase
VNPTGVNPTRAIALGAIVALVSALGVTTAGANDGPKVRLEKIAPVDMPTAMASRAGDPTLYVAEQAGRVVAVTDGSVAAEPVLDLESRIAAGGEQGLLGIIFSPDGARLFVHFTNRDGNTRVEVYDVTSDAGAPAVVDPASRRVLLKVSQPAVNHNGGQLAFGPDGHLYLGLGDGGGAGDRGYGHATGGNGQSGDTLLGKIVRIDLTQGGAEICDRGLRNPWRFSFDRGSGDLWIGDVGQNEWEELDHVPATNGRDAGRGANFGWNRLEATHPYRGRVPDGVVAPVYETAHDAGACAVIGGFVYRGTKIPRLRGTYLFSDNCDGTIRLLVPDGAGDVTMHDSGLKSESVSSFGQGNGGALYVLSQADGISRIDAGS